jgi:hypothetical protein
MQPALPDVSQETKSREEKQMKSNFIKRIIAIAAALTVTVAIGAGGASAQGSVPGNGTVTDGGLVWLKDANCFGKQNWNDATRSAASLKSGSCGLNDGSTPGQWRLPTKDELVRRQRNQQGFNNVQADDYWSSSSYVNGSGSAWVVGMLNGYVNGNYKGFGNYVWPLRAGQ